MPFRFALLGCGTIATTHAKAIASLSPRAELAACADLLPERADAFATEHHTQAASWTSILADASIHAVIICTPSGLHAQAAVQALHSGKHVLIEKPMDITAAACDRILAAQATCGLQVGVISQHRFDPASKRVHQMIESGALGNLFGVEARIPWYRTQEYYDSADWRGTMALDGGALMNQGIHTIDLMLWLAGPIRRVWALARTATHQRLEVEDHLSACLEFENGAIGSLLASTSAYPGFPVRIELYGTQGSAILEGDEIHTIALQGHPVEHGTALPGAVDVASGGTRGATQGSSSQQLGHRWVWGDAHRAQIEDFILACQSNRPPLVDGHAGKRAVTLIESIYASARANASAST
jgi:predicted dehydrogenase